MKKLYLVLIFLLLSPGLTHAHFSALLTHPSALTSGNELMIQLAFTHPRSGSGMDMAKPVAFGVLHNNVITDLLPQLDPVRFLEARAWVETFKVPAPGDYIFYVSPAPYWEEAEQRFIVHHTKTVVNAYDMQDAWDKPVGLPLEIIPLTRPYGLYPGNIFTGQVLQNGKPLANCKIEVEFFDEARQKPAANQALLTQVLKTDAQGYFSWGFPWPGWWGMSALADGGEITYNGRTGALEVGGVLWVFVEPLP